MKAYRAWITNGLTTSPASAPDAGWKRFVRVGISLVAASVVAGCASTPAPRLYVFSPHDAWQKTKTDLRDAEASDYTIRLAAVNLPSYLNRPHIVTRVSDNEIKVEQFHRWGMPLNQTVSELIREAMAVPLTNAFVDAGTATSSLQPGYLVQVDVVRLDGYLGGPVSCIAQWRVTRSGAEPVVLLQRLARYEQETTDRTHEAYIEAIRNLIATMGEDIAAAIERDRHDQQ